jgi:hypothetical protein
MTNRFLALLRLLVAGVVGLGFCLGWLSLSRDHTDQRTNITLRVDQYKVQEDTERAKQIIHDVGEMVKKKGTTPQH